MVADFRASSIQSELQDIEDEIAAVERTLYHTGWHPSIFDDKTIKSLNRTLQRLNREKSHQEQRLRIHRGRIKESGIKF